MQLPRVLVRGGALAIALAVLTLAPRPACGYGNDGPGDGDGPHGGGAHRRINALALERFSAAAKADPILARYDFSPTAGRYGLPPEHGLFFVAGRTVTKSGSWRREDSPAVTSVVEEGDLSAPFSWWVVEGGYTADEPESYMALRHFFDPLSLARDLETGASVAYLTDVEDPWIAKAFLGENPRMDARTWALSASPYSLAAGRAAVEVAAAYPTGAPERQTEWAKAWRSLGECLHLLADMTVPAHVRNDAHPGFSFKQTLSGDPYEDLVDADTVTRCAAGDAPESFRAAIAAAKDPAALFAAVATWVNARCFSKDTVSGRDGVTRGEVANANGQPSYPAPKLESFRFEGGGDGAGWYHKRDPVSDGARRRRDGTNTVDSLVATLQSMMLVPCAVEACGRWIDLTLPRVDVAVDSFDAATGRLAFRAVRLDRDESGAWTRSLPPDDPSSNAHAVAFWRAGAVAKTVALRLVPAAKGRLAVDLSALVLEARALPVPVEASVEVGLDVGGILVRSPAFALGPLGPAAPPPAEASAPAALRATRGIDVRVSGSFPVVEVPWMGAHAAFDGGNLNGSPGSREHETHPLVWTGNRFRVSYSVEGTRTPTLGNPDPKTTRTVEASGEVSADGKTLVSLVSTTAVFNSGWRQETTIRLTRVPLLEPKSRRESDPVEWRYRSTSAATVNASYSYREMGEMRFRVAPDHTASTGSGRFDLVEVRFR